MAFIQKNNSNTLLIKCSFIIIIILTNVTFVNASASSSSNKLGEAFNESKIPHNVQELISQQQIDNYNTWNKAKASEIVFDELKSFKKWAEIKSDFETNNPIHKIFAFQKQQINGSDYMIVLTYTGNDLLENIPSTDQVFLSLFEFKYVNGWILNKKNIGFGVSNQNYEGKVHFDFRPVSNDKYGLIIKNPMESNGYLVETTQIYTHIGDSLKCVFDIYSANSNIATGDGKEDYKATLNIIETGKEYYPIFLREKGTNEDGEKINNSLLFEFNGKKYLNKSSNVPYGHAF